MLKQAFSALAEQRSVRRWRERIDGDVAPIAATGLRGAQV